MDEKIVSFKDCVSSGFPIIESYPRQCKTKDGLIFEEEIMFPIIYKNSSSDLIKIKLPFPGAVVGKEFSVIGKARGTWFFEASFPVEVLDEKGYVLASGLAQTEEDWMTDKFVSFVANIKVPSDFIGKATLVLKKDNPSGIQEYEASISLPIIIEY